MRPTEGQIDDLLEGIRERVDRGERVLVTTLTKKLAEDLADYLQEMGVRVPYLHSEVDTLERVAILRDLRMGIYDVLVGINLLREGIDLPEVTLVAILDADKEGFLRSAWSLIQVIGRAARNTSGEVVMYADRHDGVDAGRDRRDEPTAAIQEAYNLEHGVEPTTIVKEIRDINDRLRAVAEATGRLRASGRESLRDAPGAGREAARAARGGDALSRQAARVRACRRAPRRDPGHPPAGARAGRVDHRGSGRRAAAKDSSNGRGLTGAADRARGRRGAAAAVAAGSAMEVTSVTVLAADEEPGDNMDGVPGEPGIDENTVADWLPGIRDEHEDEAGWQARWLDRPTWDRTVTPNIRKRTGQRPGRRR